MNNVNNPKPKDLIGKVVLVYPNSEHYVYDEFGNWLGDESVGDDFILALVLDLGNDDKMPWQINGNNYMVWSLGVTGDRFGYIPINTLVDFIEVVG